MSGSTASSPKLPRFNGPFSIQKFYHDSDAWGDKAKSNYLSVDLDVISFVLFPQASEPNENFNILIPSLSICDQLSKQQVPFGAEFVRGYSLFREANFIRIAYPLPHRGYGRSP